MNFVLVTAASVGVLLFMHGVTFAVGRSIGRYNVVDVTLTTHDCHGLSAADIDLARRMDTAAGAATVQTDHSLPVESLCQVRAR